MKDHVERIAETTGLSLDQVVRCLRAHAELLLEAAPNRGAKRKPFDPSKAVQSPADLRNRWWVLFYYAFNQGDLSRGKDFRIDGSRLHLRWNKCHDVYWANHLRMYGARGIERRAMLDLLRAGDAYIRVVRSMKMDGTNTSAIAFDLTLLPSFVGNIIANQ